MEAKEERDAKMAIRPLQKSTSIAEGCRNYQERLFICILTSPLEDLSVHPSDAASATSATTVALTYWRHCPEPLLRRIFFVHVSNWNPVDSDPDSILKPRHESTG